VGFGVEVNVGILDACRDVIGDRVLEAESCRPAKVRIATLGNRDSPNPQVRVEISPSDAALCVNERTAKCVSQAASKGNEPVKITLRSQEPG